MPCAKLVEVGVGSLGCAAEIDGLAQEQPLELEVGRALADLVGLAAGEAGHAQGVGEAKALVDLRIDPDLGPSPGPHAAIEGEIEGLPPIGVGVQAVGPRIGRGEGRIGLFGQGGLRMKGPELGPIRRRGRFRRGGERDHRREGEQSRRPCPPPPHARLSWLLARGAHIV